MNSLNFLLLGNSCLTVLFVLNQNDSTKELTTKTTSVSNPLENITWICFFLQLVLLLLKTKITDFQKFLFLLFNPRRFCMNKNMISFFLCPLPEEQKPLQMYLSLKEGWFVGWTTFSTPSYQKRLVQISLLLFFCNVSL